MVEEILEAKKLLRPAALSLLGLILICPEVRAAPNREVPPDLARRRAPPTRPRRATSTRSRPRIVLTNRAVTRTALSGGYHGVTPGLPRMPRIYLPRNASKRCYLTWTGFQLLPTGSRLFLQFNKKPTVHKEAKGAALTIKLPGCRVANWNNTRPLQTRFFPTPVRYARVRRRGRATWMTVLLKRPVAAQTRVVRLQGFYYLFITFRHTRSAWAPRVRRPPRRNPPQRRRSGRRGPQP
jgi:hypothetical protein